jgi:hypothetical protein
MGFNQTSKLVVIGRWHRRIGLLVTGMLLVFTISGIALNHQSQWDPYYTVSKRHEMVHDLAPSMDEDELDLYLRKRYGMDESLNSSLWENSRIVTMSYTNGISFEIDLRDKSIVKVVTRKRPVIYNLIHLHLNALKGVWVFIADVFAIGLIFLSISGIYLVLGRFTRIEFIYLITGTLLPVLFYLAL